MALEEKRKLACLGMFAVFPVALLGTVLDFENSQLFGYIVVALMLIGIISSSIAFGMICMCRCPNCHKRYFCFMPLLFILHSACKTCRWRDTRSSRSETAFDV